MQLNDVDALKCRSGRLTYLGMISFALIAMPMSCLLLNEFVGGAVIDAAIPAIYSALLVCGALLFSISLLFPSYLNFKNVNLM